MSLGATLEFPIDTYRDDLTGRLVRRLTSPQYRSHHQYFYMNMWTPDSRRVLVTSNRGDGMYRHYLIDVHSGQGRCVTDVEHVEANHSDIAPDGQSMLYSVGSELRRRNLSDLSEQVVYRRDEAWNSSSAGGQGIYFGVLPDHTRAVMVEMHRDDHLNPKEGWDTWRGQMESRPRCRLVELDLRTGKANVIHEDHNWLGHPQYQPGGGTIMFCHEGPWELVDSRLWFIDPDGSNLRQGRLRAADRPPGKGELWGHEFWLPDGSRAGYVYFPHTYGVDGTLRLLDPLTLHEETMMPMDAYSHFIANHDFSMIVADTHVPIGDSIFLVDIATRRPSVLCRHASSMKPYKDRALASSIRRRRTRIRASALMDGRSYSPATDTASRQSTWLTLTHNLTAARIARSPAPVLCDTWIDGLGAVACVVPTATKQPRSC